MADNTVFVAGQDLGFVYSPLSITAGTEVAGNVPPSQQFDVAQNTYYPDYTQTYLQLKPGLCISDPDGILTDEDKVVTNLAWYVFENGVRKDIAAGTEYAIGDGGVLVVKRNSDPDNPPTYVWEGDFLDVRTGEVFHLTGSMLVSCDSISSPPVLKVDMPLFTPYYPPRETNPKRTVTASLMIGTEEVLTPKVKYYWQKRDHSDMVWADLRPDTDAKHDIMDYDVKLSADRKSVTVNMEQMGHGIDLRVYARYMPFAKNSLTQAGADEYATDWVDEKTPVVEMTFEVRYPKIQGIILGARRIPAQQKYIYPEGLVKDPVGVIPNPEKYFDIIWRVSTGNAQGTVALGTPVATGATPKIPVNLARRYGGYLRMEVKPKSPLAAALDKDDNVLTDDGGTIMLI